jgi:hypothetical protein
MHHPQFCELRVVPPPAGGSAGGRSSSTFQFPSCKAPNRLHQILKERGERGCELWMVSDGRSAGLRTAGVTGITGRVSCGNRLRRRTDPAGGRAPRPSGDLGLAAQAAAAVFAGGDAWAAG